MANEDPTQRPESTMGLAVASEAGEPSESSPAEAVEPMVIFVKTFDFLAWLLPLTNHFPRAHRHTLTRRLVDAALDLRERLEEANKRTGGARRERLDRADEQLALVRLYLRLAYHMKWMTSGQYFHGARAMVDIGRLLGGWKRARPPRS
jgi:hypothetical protein